MIDLIPMYQKGLFNYPTAMALAVALGLGFGFALERAGFGRASVLAAQFYGTDMRVLKVMFTAIVTTSVGIGLLGGLGLMDLGALRIPETWLWPQILGGLLLGAGFIVAGYCPGTAAVATASGKIDGIVALVGVMIGSLVFGFAYPLFEGLYLSGEMGVQHLPALSGLSWGAIGLGVFVMAVGAFFGGEWVERWVAKRTGGEVPPGDPQLRNRLFMGLGVAAFAGLAAGFLPSPTRTAPVKAVAPISADALAERLVADSTSVYLVDLRAPEACTAKRLPGALCLPAEDQAAFFAGLPASRELVVYGQRDSVAPAAAQAFTGRLAALEGGFDGFHARYLTASPPSPEASPTERAAWEKRNAMYAYFTGSAAAKAPPPPPRKVIQRAAKKGGGC